MTSHPAFLRHTAAPMESPAKVFAKLKSRVEKEAMFAKPGRITNNNTQRHARDVHGSGRRTESTWMMEDKENKEDRGLSVCPCDAEALTLSPIATPQKSLGCGYEDLSAMSPRKLLNITNEFTPRKRAPLESTAASRPPGRQINGVPGVCRMIERTPTKLGEGVCAGSVSEHRPPLDQLMSPAKVFSSMKEKIRKRKWELDSEPTRERNNFTSLNTDNDVKVEDLLMNPFVTPQVPIKKQRCHLPPVSPTKMFGYLWERKRQQPEGQKVSSSTRGLHHAGHRPCFPDDPATTTFSEEQPENITPDSLAESVTPASRSTFEAADSQSDNSPSGAQRVPVVLSQPVLLVDPLVLNSPQISIPNKRKAVAYMDNKRPVAATYLSESKIYLRNWSVESSRKGLYVDGIHRDDGIAWHSNIIAERVTGSTLKTVSGRIYVLVGKMNAGVQSEFPKWFLRKFTQGFPPDWKTLYETFLSGAGKCSDASKEAKRSNKRGPVRSRTVSETPDSKPCRQRAAPDSCPPSTSSAKVSRSGRVIKPPLEYWKGGRVMLDAHMNVTIHECYDTSFCKPEVTTTVSTRMTNKPVRVLLPCGEDREEPSGPRRRVKAPQHKWNQTKDIPGRKPSKPSGPNVRLEPVLAHDLSSPEQQCSQGPRSRQRGVVPQSRPESNSRKQMHEANRSSARLAEKRAVSSATESPTTGSQESDLDSSVKRKKTHRKRQAKTQPLSMQPLESPEDGRRRQRSRTAAAQTKHKQRKCATTSPPPPPTETKAKPSKKHDKSRNTGTRWGRDEDEWTEGELRKLHKAVTSYPKHMTDYWANVAMVVGTRSAEECHVQHTSQQGAQVSPGKRANKPRKAPTAAKAPDHPVISARVGTLKRKQQVRQFLEAMPKDDMGDVFSSAHMQSKRFELPSMCPSDDQDFALSDQEPLSPSSVGFPEAKTPRCLHITPGMMGSPSRNNDDKYIFQLQRRMKKSQFKVCKQAPPIKNFTPTPSIKRSLKRCGETETDTFLIREMFPEKDGVLSDSGEEEDFYFSDND
ncbi:mis18-binding protein 1 [Genypterus blacodes]|uniref:mis18-binding protein 1 n=1 Tax=Genypterus blacodes TaxID=154954 RepID=UPI003F76BF04